MFQELMIVDTFAGDISRCENATSQTKESIALRVIVNVPTWLPMSARCLAGVFGGVNLSVNAEGEQS